MIPSLRVFWAVLTNFALLSFNYKKTLAFYMSSKIFSSVVLSKSLVLLSRMIWFSFYLTLLINRSILSSFLIFFSLLFAISKVYVSFVVFFIRLKRSVFSLFMSTYSKQLFDIDLWRDNSGSYKLKLSNNYPYLLQLLSLFCLKETCFSYIYRYSILLWFSNSLYYIYLIFRL